MNTENTYNIEEKVKEFEKVAQFLDNSEPFKDRSNWLRTALQSAHAEGVKAGMEQEREKFCIILKKLYEAGDDRKQMTMEFFLKFKALTPDNNV